MICLYCQKKIETAPLHGFHRPCFMHSFGLSMPEDFLDLSLINEKKSFSKWNESFFHGAFRKYGAKLGEKDYILKVQQSEFPELPLVEYLSNKIALVWNLQIPSFSFIHFNNSLPTFVTENFMGSLSGANLIHIYHYIKEGEAFNCENLLQIIYEKTRARHDVLIFIRMCLFDAFIGNHDRHGRNIALIQKSHQLRLAPIYDNPSYIGIEDDVLLGADLNPTGRISTQETENPLFIDYVIEFVRLGFQNDVRQILERVNISSCLHLIEESCLSEKRKKAFLKLISKKQEEWICAKNYYA